MTMTLSGTSGGIGVIGSGTAVASTSGTSIDFTSLPAGLKRITVMFNGVSTSGTSPIQIQLGYSGGFEVSGYAGAAGSRGGESYNSAGFLVNRGQTAAVTGNCLATIASLGSNAWAMSGVWGASSSDVPIMFAGAKTLSGTLDRVRITTSGGTDTFDAGSINILYE